MKELIERLEKATTGPSRELDADIACAAFPNKYVVAHKPFKPGLVGVSCAIVDNGHGYISVCDAPAYTASLDAAMTLVPDGHDWYAQQIYGAPFEGSEWKGCTAMVGKHPVGGPLGHERHRGHALTPALALCIASLKARTGGSHG